MGFRIEHLHKARGRVLREAAPKVSSGTQWRQGAAVVAAVLVEDLGLSCVEACEADGAVVGFTPTGGEEETIEIPRCQLRQQRRKLGAHRDQADSTIDERCLLHLLEHRLFYRRWNAVAQIHAHGFRGPVQVFLPVAVVDINTLGSLQDGQRADRTGGRPGEHCMVHCSFSHIFGRPGGLPMSLAWLAAAVVLVWKQPLPGRFLLEACIDIGIARNAFGA
mmetsp:Transcript_85749/g.136170  ORF Transcript_85749/g.136170 Transcript_85749/m.136170 type:complete len:220 (+) Transcript_85749:1017-1676(+)